jgi:hypothetical protein
VDPTALRARADELALRPEDIDSWAAAVDDRLVEALLGSLIRFEDALLELSG